MAETAQQPQQAPKATQTLVDALADLFSVLAHSWNRPLEEALGRRDRFIYAFSGSWPWLIYNLRSDSLNYALAIFGGKSGGLSPTVLASVTFGAQMLLAAWFAWLISYQGRQCSPSRFFLEGILFPGIAAALLKGSFLLELFGLGG